MGSRGAQAKSDRGAQGPSSLALMEAVGSFIRAYKGWMRSLLADLTSTESNPSRVMLMVSLRRSGQTMGNLAAHLGLPKSNITALVDALEGEGLLRRRPDATDRRVTQLELTAKGRALCEREYDAYEQALAALFDDLPGEERAPMFSGLERLTKRLRDEGAGVPAESSSTGAASPSRPRKSAKSGGAADKLFKK